jgi:hypothetical protein
MHGEKYIEEIDALRTYLDISVVGRRVLRSRLSRRLMNATPKAASSAREFTRVLAIFRIDLFSKRESRQNLQSRVGRLLARKRLLVQFAAEQKITKRRLHVNFEDVVSKGCRRQVGPTPR